MRGSFKQIKKKGVWSPSLSHSALLLLKTIWLFALQSANLSFSLTLFILTLYRSCLCMYIWSFLTFPPSFLFLFLTRSLLCLALLHSDHLFFFGCHFPLLLLLFFFFMSFHYLSLSLYLCIILVNGKQRCHCGSILSAQRVADGRNLCRL